MRAALALWILALALPGWAAERYYVVMLGYDSRPASLEKAHTFVDFLAVDGERVTAEKTVSWLPRRDGGRFTPPLGKPEPAMNASLAQTLQLARENGRTVVYWEPLEIDEDLYRAAETRAQYLGRAPVGFVLFDGAFAAGFGTSEASGVAVSSVTAANVAEPRGFGFLSGARASQAVLEHFGPYLLSPRETRPELLEKVMVGAETLKAALREAQVQDVWNLRVRGL
jgi:hypothetical protein